MTVAGGSRVDFSDLVDTPPPSGARAPKIGRTPRAVPVEQVAANPRNTRKIGPETPGVLRIRDSIEKQGQLEATAAVTRSAYLELFPEDAEAIGPAAVYVQVTGGQRREACRLLGRDLEISVKDELAESRRRFLEATATENLDRSDYNAVEEANAIAQIVVENGGNQAETARQLGYDRSWVTHRMNVLKLDPQTQALCQEHQIAVRDVRGSLHRRPVAEQMATIHRIVKSRQAKDDADLDDAEATTGAAERPAPRQRTSPIIAAIRRLGSTPAEIGTTLRKEMSREERESLAKELLRDE